MAYTNDGKKPTVSCSYILHHLSVLPQCPVPYIFTIRGNHAVGFVRRGFSECPFEAIPEERRKRINLARGSKYYMKKLQQEAGGITVNQSAFI